MENIVAQMLTANGHKLFFYANSSRDNKDDRMELDFLLPKNHVTRRHNINFIEVKSGDSYHLISLKKAMAKYANEMNKAIVLHTDNVMVSDGITFLPVYMAGLL